MINPKLSSGEDLFPALVEPGADAAADCLARSTISRRLMTTGCRSARLEIAPSSANLHKKHSFVTIYHLDNSSQSAGLVIGERDSLAPLGCLPPQVLSSANLQQRFGSVLHPRTHPDIAAARTIDLASQPGETFYRSE